MLITRAKPAELWGKKVYDTNGHLLGEVVAIGSRRGAVRKVVVQKTPFDRPVRLAPPADVHVHDNVVTFRRLHAGRPWLRLLH
jgi:sporulation protein YlmC with PRC-barrel domain